MLNIRWFTPKLSSGMATPWATLEQTAAGRPVSHVSPVSGLKGPAGEVNGLKGWVLPMKTSLCASAQYPGNVVGAAVATAGDKGQSGAVTSVTALLVNRYHCERNQMAP